MGRSRVKRGAQSLYLIFKPDTAFSKKTSLQALIVAGVECEVVSQVDSDRASEAIVAADIAVTTMLEGFQPSHLECIDSSGKLPDLGVQKINMYGDGRQSDYAQRLMDILRNAVRDI